MKLTITGDVHGRFPWLNKITEKEKPDLLICCGDFGYWPTFNWTDIKAIKTNICPIWWIDGNHEDFGYLNKRASDEIIPNIWYKPRGTVEKINGKNFLFLGGGFSIDYKYRTEGFDLFADDEMLKDIDIEKIPKRIKIDTVISHTAPEEFIILGRDREMRFPDDSRRLLSKVLVRYKPAHWWFGHWHIYKHGEYWYDENKACEWTCLNMVDDYSGYRTIEV